ncbi:unnamed protein product [Rotaria socialis]|uniref:Beta-lactamase-related domain-containing protein n=1 Tax=Rotaria socialis TaxID=392032 RepID=A0A819ASU3_9BILA|nr:unnamed protein product [Rotaria socialis]
MESGQTCGEAVVKPASSGSPSGSIPAKSLSDPGRFEWESCRVPVLSGAGSDGSRLNPEAGWSDFGTLEQREPQWSPGTAHDYHPLTYGWLADELVRRVDPKNRTFGQWVRDEITNPLQIEFYIGLPLEQEYRVSPIETVLNNFFFLT